MRIWRQAGKSWLLIDRLRPELPGQESPASCDRLYAKDITVLDPQGLDICDLEGDGVPELFIKVKKSTTYHPECINRPFFFNFHDDSLYAKWTGSTFGDPFRDAYFINYFGDGRDLVFIVGLLPEGMRISAHAWQGFGFQFLGESPLYPWIGDLHKGEHGIVADLGGQTQEFILSGHGPERHLLEWPLAEN